MCSRGRQQVRPKVDPPIKDADSFDLFSIFVFEEFCSSRYLAMTLLWNNLCDMRKQNGNEAMQIEISPQNSEFIDRQVARGEFRDRSAALDAAVELLRRRTDTLEKIDNGRQQLDAGEFKSMTTKRSKNDLTKSNIKHTL